MKEDEYKKHCDEIREQIKPREGFIDELKVNLQKEVERRNEVKIRRIKYLKAAVAMCCILIISTGAVAFADDIGDCFIRWFKNSDPSSEIALENGIKKEFDMDYVEHEGIGIKVNSVIINDNNLDIILDVRGEIEGKIKFDKINIKSSEDLKNTNYEYQKIEFKRKDKNSHILLIKFFNINDSILNSNELFINLETANIVKKDNEIKKIEEKWNYKIELK